MPKRYELTAEQWRKIEGLLPGKLGDRGRTAKDNRAFVNAVLWVLRSGANWQHLPQERYANWKSAHKRFTRWSRAGVWEKIFSVLVADPKNDYISIDSTIVRAHQMAITGKGGARTRLWGVPEEAWELKFIC